MHVMYVWPIYIANGVYNIEYFVAQIQALFTVYAVLYWFYIKKHAVPKMYSDNWYCLDCQIQMCMPRINQDF